jgi:GntR family transcriptional regulator, rspAB operon transcriptional repressor
MLSAFSTRGRNLAKGAHSKADAVYGELKEAILAGVLEPGGLIDKAVLCEKLGVSRFPVSAAVSRLAYDRLVDVAPQHGSFVSRISINDVRERLFIRSALEGEIAAEAARRMSRADKDALVANLKEAAVAVEADDRASFYVADVAFHQALTARLGMARATEVLDSLRVHLERARRLLMSPAGRIREVLCEHRAIVDAVEAGDPSLAREAMKRHLSVTGDLLETVARQRPEMFTP